jgi:hypothetical protein
MDTGCVRHRLYPAKSRASSAQTCISKAAVHFCSLLSGYRAYLRGRFVDRQRNNKHRAMWCVRCRRKATAVCFDDRATDRQADAKPLCLGRIKGLKQVRCMLRVQSRPRVAHFNGYGIRPIRGGHYRQLAGPLFDHGETVVRLQSCLSICSIVPWRRLRSMWRPGSVWMPPG